MPDNLPVETVQITAGLPVETAALVQAYQRASKADATLRAYRSDARVFEAWCRRFGFRSLPTTAEAVSGLLVAEAEVGRSASTIGRRLAAIGYAHKLAKAADPTDDENVRATMKGIRRRVGVAPTQKAAATVDVLQMLLARTPDTLIRGRWWATSGGRMPSRDTRGAGFCSPSIAGDDFRFSLTLVP